MDNKTNEFEICILCGEITQTPVSTPLELRTNYEVGCGQLCEACYRKLHSDIQTKNKNS